MQESEQHLVDQDMSKHALCSFLRMSPSRREFASEFVQCPVLQGLQRNPNANFLTSCTQRLPENEKEQ